MGVGDGTVLGAGGTALAAGGGTVLGAGGTAPAGRAVAAVQQNPQQTAVQCPSIVLDQPRVRGSEQLGLGQLVAAAAAAAWAGLERAAGRRVVSCWYLLCLGR